MAAPYFLAVQYDRDTNIVGVARYRATEIGICDTTGREKSWSCVSVGGMVISPLMMKAQANEILEFVADPAPQFWGYFCATDWVCFMAVLRGVKLPMKFPIYCNELAQEFARRGTNLVDIPKSDAVQSQGVLGDARWVRNAYWYINGGK